MTSIAIIGGTGLCDWPGVELGDTLAVAGDYGSPSASLQRIRYLDAEFLFLPRHGAGHVIPPHRINYRANIHALQRCGISSIIAVNAVGGIGRNYDAGVIAVPDQINDYTWGREHTFFDGSGGGGLGSRVEHIDFSYPYSELLRQVLIASAGRCNIPVQPSGTYAVTQGPRLETVAEIRRLARDGNDLVGMTAMPEAALARELGIAYASLCLVVNPAAGETEALITMEDIQAVLATGMERVKAILAECVRGLSAVRD